MLDIDFFWVGNLRKSGRHNPCFLLLAKETKMNKNHLYLMWYSIICLSPCCCGIPSTILLLLHKILLYYVCALVQIQMQRIGEHTVYCFVQCCSFNISVAACIYFDLFRILLLPPFMKLKICYFATIRLHNGRQAVVAFDEREQEWERESEKTWQKLHDFVLFSWINLNMILFSIFVFFVGLLSLLWFRFTSDSKNR